MSRISASPQDALEQHRVLRVPSESMEGARRGVDTERAFQTVVHLNWTRTKDQTGQHTSLRMRHRLRPPRQG